MISRGKFLYISVGIVFFGISTDNVIVNKGNQLSENRCAKKMCTFAHSSYGFSHYKTTKNK